MKFATTPGAKSHRETESWTWGQALSKYWVPETKSTHNLLLHLTDASLSQRADPEGWSLGKIAWHLTTCICEMMKTAGLPVMDLRDDMPAPESAVELAASYLQVASTFQQQLQAQWTDAMLADELSMYGQVWTRMETLMILLAHQTHHRGQMTILMRMAGLTVPGVCGPSREEWAAIRG